MSLRTAVNGKATRKHTTVRTFRYIWKALGFRDKVVIEYWSLGFYGFSLTEGHNELPSKTWTKSYKENNSSTTP